VGEYILPDGSRPSTFIWLARKIVDASATNKIAVKDY